MLLYIIGKKLFPKDKKCDSFLNDIDFQNIKNNQIKSAIKLLEYTENKNIEDIEIK